MDDAIKEFDPLNAEEDRTFCWIFSCDTDLAPDDHKDKEPAVQEVPINTDGDTMPVCASCLERYKRVMYEIASQVLRGEN